MSTLERAIAIAAEAHAGVRDKGGSPYILHPIAVMMKMTTDEERIVAVLHDVVEDTDWTFEALRAEGFSEAVIAGLDAVTRRKGETYEDFVMRAARDPIGRPVKLADLESNSDISRIPEPTEKDYRRLERYARAEDTIMALDAAGPTP